MSSSLRLRLTDVIEGMYILSTGAETDNGYGITIQYIFGKYHFSIATKSRIWSIDVSTEVIKPHGFETLCLTWHNDAGIQIFVNKVMVAWQPVYVERTVTVTTILTYYFASTLTTVANQVFGHFELQDWAVYYAHWVILISTAKFDGKSPVFVQQHLYQLTCAVAPQSGQTHLISISITVVILGNVFNAQNTSRDLLFC